jgi:acylphosphatase
MKILEKLGVPLEFIEQVSELYEDFLKDLSKLTQRKIKKVILSGDKEIVVGFYNIKYGDNSFELPIKIEFVEVEKEQLPKGDSIVLVSAGLKHKTKAVLGGNKKARVEYTSEDASVEIVVAFYDMPTKEELEQLIKKYFTSDTLAHELKHFFDINVLKQSRLEDISFYKSIQMGKFPKFIREFFFLLYFTTSIENSVRASEMYQKMKEKEITKQDFKNFFEETNTIKQLRKAKNFSLNDFIEELKKDEIMTEIIEDDEYQRKFDEEYKDMLNIILINLNNEYLETFQELSSKLGFEFMIKRDKEKLTDLEKHLDSVAEKRKKLLEDPLKYFEELEKLLNLAGDKMIKKLSKLYDMAPQNQDNNKIFNWDLHTKINSRNENIITKFENFNLFTRNK